MLHDIVLYETAVQWNEVGSREAAQRFSLLIGSFAEWKSSWMSIEVCILNVHSLDYVRRWICRAKLSVSRKINFNLLTDSNRIRNWCFTSTLTILLFRRRREIRIKQFIWRRLLFALTLDGFLNKKLALHRVDQWSAFYDYWKAAKHSIIFKISLVSVSTAPMHEGSVCKVS